MITTDPNGGDRAAFNRIHRQTRDARIGCARIMLPPLLRMIQPSSVLDVGCGLGAWLTVAGEQGIGEVLGMDGPWIDRSLLHIDSAAFRHVDLAAPFSAGRRFDLCISLEVAEHLPPTSADGFVASLVSHADVVLFSAAIPGQGGNGHINEQFQDFWAHRFARHDYVAFDLVRRQVWLDPDVFWWLQQNTILYVRRTRIPGFPALTSATVAEPHMLPLVHPSLYIQWLRRYGELSGAGVAGAGT